MKHIFLFLLSFGFIGVSFVLAGFFLQTSEAQEGGEIEDYTEEDKSKTFQRLQFHFYVLASDIGDGNQFLDNIESQRAAKVLKSLPTKAQANLWCNHSTYGEIYQVYGAYVFKNDIDAQQIKEWLKDNLPINKIRYAEFYLLENNHHWDNPTHDIILEHRIYGNEQLFRQVESEC